MATPCTPSASCIEHLTIYAGCIDTESSDVRIHEHFLVFTPVEVTTCSVLAECILKKLSDTNITIASTRGRDTTTGQI